MKPIAFAVSLAAFIVSTASTVYAQAPAPVASPTASPQALAPEPDKAERWSLHMQVTNTQQYHGAFPAAYTGANSLTPTAQTDKTLSATLFLGGRLWKGGEFYINPEFDQGFGFNNTLGLAGFSSGEAYKVGAGKYYGRAHRYFMRQTFNYGGGSQNVDANQNQLAGPVDANHLTITAGKYSVVDIFDNNDYAHDPRNDFLNWSIIDMGAFDYAADAWGFTYGATAELYHGNSAVRVGLFQLSKVPNTTIIEKTPFLQYSPVVEVERDISLFGGHPGKIRALMYGNYGYMAPLADATDAAAGTGLPPDVSLFRQNRHWKIGEGLNIEQEIAPHIGFFSRLSASNGTYEAFDFTEIDRSVSAGFSFDGTRWHRPNDTFGIAAVSNALSTPHQQYFAAGGLGILIGDGGLSYSGEHVYETYYKLALVKGLSVKGDFQRVINPAYNTVRGPVSIYTLQFHEQL